MLEIHQIPVLSDNYIYLIHEPESEQTAVVDPALAAPVLAALQKKGWRLSQILNTHHHWDHVGGNQLLKEKTGCSIIGSASDHSRIPGIDQRVSDRDSIGLGRHEARIIEVSGHTMGHIAFWFPTDEVLFCGDTLFALGCGRLFEGSAQQMWASLCKLSALPANTRIYCAHEYTQDNAKFALTIEPDNMALQKRVTRVQQLRADNLPTVPFSLADELATNPFLRADQAGIRHRLGLENATAGAVFAEIRQRKDCF